MLLKKKTKDKSKSSVSNIRTLYWVILKDVTKRTWHDPDYKTQNKKSEKKDYLPGNHYNLNILCHTFSFYFKKKQ